MLFSELGLCPELLPAVAEAKYPIPTPVQAAAIPPILGAQGVSGLVAVTPASQRLRSCASVLGRSAFISTEAVSPMGPTNRAHEVRDVDRPRARK
jgi:hypothetical protein